MLEFEDIQHITVTRVPAITGRYEFLSFREPAQGRAWLAGILDKVASAQEASASLEKERRWISVAFMGRSWRSEWMRILSRPILRNFVRAWSRVRRCLAIPA
jgi:hypothetical protein